MYMHGKAAYVIDVWFSNCFKSVPEAKTTLATDLSNLTILCCNFVHMSFFLATAYSY